MRGKERRWKLVALLAAGMAIGVAMTATPAVSHVGGTVAHLWSHLKPLADARYANVVTGTDVAKKADTIDGFHANQLVRSAQGEFTNVPLTSTTVELVSANITAPRPGFLLVDASAVFTVSAPTPLIHCGLEIDDGGGWPATDARSESVTAPSGPIPCASTYRFAVSAGNHKVAFEAHNDGSGSLNARGGSIHVLYVPFGQAGSIGAPARLNLRGGAGAGDVNH